MANNNFFLSQDPLLFQSPYSQPLHNMPADDGQLRQQLNDAYLRYKDAQERTSKQQAYDDYIGELDLAMKNASEDAVKALNENEEYLSLNAQLQEMVQKEIMTSIKWRLNSNPSVVRIVQRQKELIDETNREIAEEEKRNMNELNDYMKNYSDMTFNEYKQVKQKARKNNKKKEISDDNQ